MNNNNNNNTPVDGGGGAAEIFRDACFYLNGEWGKLPCAAISESRLNEAYPNMEDLPECIPGTEDAYKELMQNFRYVRHANDEYGKERP